MILTSVVIFKFIFVYNKRVMSPRRVINTFALKTIHNYLRVFGVQAGV